MLTVKANYAFEERSFVKEYNHLVNMKHLPKRLGPLIIPSLAFSTVKQSYMILPNAPIFLFYQRYVHTAFQFHYRS
jgi:hypothetical protein